MDALMAKWRTYGVFIQASLGIVSFALLFRKLRTKPISSLPSSRPPPIAHHITYYCNPLCPFSHRVALVIAELGIAPYCTFHPIPLSLEIDRCKLSGKTEDLPRWSFELGISSSAGLQTLKDWYIERFQTGAVPIVVVDHSLVVKESDLIVEYLCALFPHCSQTLFPDGAQELYRIRLAIRTFPVSQFYAVLRNMDKTKEPDLLKALLAGLKEFTSHMNMDKGPYYLGTEFSVADCIAIPFVVRFQWTLSYYRSVDLLAGTSKRFQEWFHASKNRPSFKLTVPQERDVLDVYESMGRGTFAG